ncbi:MAG TPA: polysaccharide biosynthesis tyrosine autokinase [Gemmatimonadaceae bacterium]|jgi:capsular exopolysaccharide synthesis family protein|nr:polysaccharide biosynthesis tyrosine autokinase [Gemmatimonadaceae bacterium]
MSGNILPLPSAPEPRGTAIVPAATPALPAYYGTTTPPPPSGTSQFQRYLAAIGRFKWLILVATLLGATIGLIASRFVDPEYEVVAKIWIDNNGSPIDQTRSGPAQANELLPSAAWRQLFVSGRVQDEVVRRLSLYLQPDNPRDSVYFRGFQLAGRFSPGDYELSVGSDGRSFRLMQNDQTVADQGVVGDSVGRPMGLLWRPDPRLLTAGRSVRFAIVPPREAAAQLTRRLTPDLTENFLTLRLTGTDPVLAAATLNTWVDQFVIVANELKRQKLVYYANVQKEQLLNSEQAMREAELARQRFKVQTITEPSEQTAVAPGLLETQGTVQTAYFQKRMQLVELGNGRRTLERLVGEARAGNISESSLIQLGSLTSTVPAAVSLKNTLDMYFRLMAELKANREVFTDEAPVIIDINQRLNTIRRTTIPQEAGQLLAALRAQETELNRQIGAAQSELRGIPQRSMEEQRLNRDVDVNDALYRQLQQQAAVADLAALSATPDVSILDSAVAPLRPSTNTTPQIMLIAILGSLGLAIVIALLVDRVDNRFRYPEQAKNELGLDLLGAVPVLTSARKGRQDPEEAAQVVESFRLVRLNIRHAIEGAGPVMLTVSSPQAADGKSLVASNLALSFAEAGYRTLLIDGDIRRGALHSAFGISQKPGLADYLLGQAERKDVLCATSHPNLTVVPCGRRSKQGPELLASAQMEGMLTAMRATHEVIIVDSPPLSAGIDPYALATATEHLIIVLRAGKTNMKLAQAKIAVLDRLPVHVVGTVLNAITTKGIYEYYAYDYGYAADDEEESVPQLAAGVEDEEERR